MKAAQAKIDSLTSSKKRRSVDERQETCSTVISWTKRLTIFIGQSPRSRKIKVKIDEGLNIYMYCRKLPL